MSRGFGIISRTHINFFFNKILKIIVSFAVNYPCGAVIKTVMCVSDHGWTKANCCQVLTFSSRKCTLIDYKLFLSRIQLISFSGCCTKGDFNHDVILLQLPESSSFFLSYLNFLIIVRFR